MGSRTKTRRKQAAVGEFEEPTPEQLLTGEFRQGGNLATAANDRGGMAYRRIPVIVTLAETGKLSKRQFDGLSRYRDVAVAADRSELRSCIDFSVRGGGEGLPHFGVRLNIELGRLERDLGALFHIARAVAVDDMTLSQWAIKQAGSIMRSRALGAKIVTWFEPRRAAAKIALADIRMAGERLAAAIGA